MLPKNKASATDCVVIVLATIVGIIVLIPGGLIALTFEMENFNDWNYSRHRTDVDAKLLKIGLPNVPDDFGKHARKPDFAVPSPDGAWTLEAQWVDVRGYNWGVRNNRTGKIYLRTEKIRSDNWFPPRLDALWSPDGAYVAVTSEDGVEVAHMRGDKAVNTQLSLGESDWEKTALLNATDQADFYGWCGGRIKALAWEGPKELDVASYIDVRMKSDNSERVVAAHEMLRFHDEAFDLTWKKCDFYESLPDPD